MRGIDHADLPDLAEIDPSALGRGNTLRGGVVFDADGLASGMYPYALTVTNVYPRSRIGGVIEGDVLVVNEKASPFGAGWMLDGVFRLAFDPGEAAKSETSFTGAGTTRRGPPSEPFLETISEHPQKFSLFEEAILDTHKRA